MQRCVHYEKAFEHFLRANRLPYVAVDEARKTLLPLEDDVQGELLALKSFDFIVYAPGVNLIIDIKGRRRSTMPRLRCNLTRPPGGLQNWVVMEDVHAMGRWQEMFGSGFSARFLFMYWLPGQPPDALFESTFSFHDRWYALREITVADYRRVMLPRSSRWRTVHMPAADFARLSQPFCPSTCDRAGADSACSQAAAALS